MERPGHHSEVGQHATWISIALSGGGHQKFPSTSQKCLVFGVETLKKNRMCLGKTVQIMQK